MIIGLIGQARVGKTTFADYLVQLYGYNTVAFATPIKEAMRVAFDLNDEQIDGKLKEVEDKRWGVTPRQLYQKFGTDWARNLLGQDVWIKRLKIELKKNTDRHTIVSDIRFPNEAKAVKDMGGILIKITKKGIEIKENSHISEKLIDKIDYDYIIENNYDIPRYYKDIDLLLDHIIRKQ